MYIYLVFCKDKDRENQIFHSYHYHAYLIYKYFCYVIFLEINWVIDDNIRVNWIKMYINILRFIKVILFI